MAQDMIIADATVPPRNRLGQMPNSAQIKGHSFARVKIIHRKLLDEMSFQPESSFIGGL